MSSFKHISFLILTFCSVLLAFGQESVSLVPDQPNKNYYDSYTAEENLQFIKYFDDNLNYSYNIFDGNTFESIPLPSLNAASKYLGALNTDFYFTDTSNNNMYETIYKYNGVDIETILLNDSFSSFVYLGTINNKIYFVGRVLFETPIFYSYDGNTLTQEELPGDLNGDNFYFSEALNQLIFFLGILSDPLTLWTYDGTSFTEVPNPAGIKGGNIFVDYDGAVILTYTEDNNNPNEDFLYKYDGSSLDLVSGPANSKFWDVIGLNENNLFVNYIDATTEERSLFSYNGEQLSIVENDPDLEAYWYGGLFDGKEIFVMASDNLNQSFVTTFDGNIIETINGLDNHHAPIPYGSVGDKLLFRFLNDNSESILAEYTPGDDGFNVVNNVPSGYTLDNPLQFTEGLNFYRYNAENGTDPNKLMGYNANGLFEIELPENVGVNYYEFDLNDVDYFTGIQNDPFSLKLYSYGNTLGFEEVSLINNQAIVYPNPFTDTINIDLSKINNLENGLITIYSVEGKLIDSILINESNSQTNYLYNSEKLNNGIYIVTVKTNLFTQTIKIVK